MSKLAQDTFYLSISSILFMISGYIVNILLGKLFNPYEYGVYGVILAFVTVINIIQTSGLPQAVTKYISENELKSNEILKNGLILQLITTCIFSLLIFLLSPAISMVLKDPSLEKYFRISSLIFPFYGIFTLYLGYYNGRHQFKKQAKMSIIYYFFKTTFVLLFAYTFSLTGALIAFIISPIPSIISSFKIPKSKISKNLLSKLFIFSLPLIGFSLLSTLLQSVDIFFVKAMSPLQSDSGYYAASQNIARIIFFGLSAFSLLLFPSISKNVSLNLHQKSRDLIHQSLRATFLLLVPSAILISATGTSLIKLLYSDAYSPAAPSLSILIIGISFLTVFSMLANILSGAGKPVKALLISLVGVLITICSCIILIPKMGLVGAALSTSFGSLIALIIAAYFVYQKFQALINPITLLKILSASLIIYIPAKYIPVPITALPLFYIVLFSLYFAILIFLKEINEQDYKRVLALLPVKLTDKFYVKK